MLEGAVIGAFGGLLGALLLFWRARAAKGDKYLTAMPPVTASFDVNMPPAAVMATLESGIPDMNARVEGRDEANGTLLLAQAPSLNAYGNFFPIRVSSSIGGGSKIEVGAAPRATGNKKQMQKILDKFVPELKKTLGVPAA